MTKTEREKRRCDTVRRFEQSSMTRKAFSEANGVALSTLDLWIRRRRDESIDQESKPLPMVSVGVAEPRSAKRRIRFTGSSKVIVELDLPATEEEIIAVLRAVASV
jgi:hypothetical protein